MISMAHNTCIAVTKYRESLLKIRAYLLRFLICLLRQAKHLCCVSTCISQPIAMVRLAWHILVLQLTNRSSTTA